MKLDGWNGRANEKLLFTLTQNLEFGRHGAPKPRTAPFPQTSKVMVYCTVTCGILLFFFSLVLFCFSAEKRVLDREPCSMHKS